MTGVPLSEAKAKADGISSWATPVEDVCVLVEVEEDFEVVDVLVEVVDEVVDALEEVVEVEVTTDVVLLVERLDVAELLEAAAVVMALDDELVLLLEDAVDNIGLVVTELVMLSVVVTLDVPIPAVVLWVEG